MSGSEEDVSKELKKQEQLTLSHCKESSPNKLVENETLTPKQIIKRAVQAHN